MPAVGERVLAPGAVLPSEWTGSVWAPVCPEDGVPIDVWDDENYLCCRKCGRRHGELVKMARAGQ